ncbi:hypothetical protein A946_11665 [Methylacidiphilum kamchatkense Kam1]|uniref:Uncharacterized protein n=1 Tax=Methylacidiphilum kamchatkense Kam1 TaxID=1202785 RepID=A0A0C1UPK4_9BACT|nr:hypothetical protein [Methylacidiphilum kamchatkense]KIE57728.1 hypothetical protein A946_11665 [Methylacidiphilum kamchatkense Kam1]QDQ41509.1 hypothetical protein kam1_254 [Methylacidiphilum kamchatkense Kam1]
MKTPFYLLIWFFCFFFVLSCAHQEAIRVKKLTQATYSPTRYVEVMYHPPKRKYVKIAELDTRSAEGTPKTQLISALVMKARELGAEALIVEDNSTTIGYPFVMNNTGGMYDTVPTRIVPAFHAIAIRYLEE